MVINAKKERKNHTLCMLLALAAILITGCSQNLHIHHYNVSDDASLPPLMAIENSDTIEELEGSNGEVLHDEYIIENNPFLNHPFLGVWLLEKTAYIFVPVFDLLLDEIHIYYPPSDVVEFLGYELEFSLDFVRLGDRKLYEPEYRISLTSEKSLFAGSEFWPPGSYAWEAGYFDSPSDLFSSLRNQGEQLGHLDSDTGETYFMRVSIDYPKYPVVMWRSELLDPELFVGFNPLFQGFLMLNDNHMLIGGDRKILARRVG